MKRAPWLYTLMQIALWSIHGVLISYAQRYLAGMGMRDSAIGLLLGGATAAGFVLQPLLAAVCDRSRLTVRLTLLTGGGLMLLCCAALLPAAKSLTLTAAFYAVACCMAQTVPSFVNALGMAAERKGMRLNFGISRGAGSIGFGLTAQLANVLLLRGGLRTVPLYSLCLAAILTATALCFPRTAENAPEAETERASGLGRFLRGSPRFCLLLAGAFLLFFGHNTLASYLYRVAQWKGNADAQGTATMLAALLELPILFGFPFLLRKAGSGVWLRLSGVFFTLRLLLTLVLPGTAGFYLAQCMQMGGFALYTVSSVYYVNEIIPVQDAVKGQSFLGAAGTIGAVAANVLGGALLDASGVPLLLTVCTIVSAVGAAIVWCAVQTKSTPPAEFDRLRRQNVLQWRYSLSNASVLPDPGAPCRTQNADYPLGFTSEGTFLYGQRRTIHHRPSPDIFCRSIGSGSLEYTKYACTSQTLARPKISRRMLSINCAAQPERTK